MKSKSYTFERSDNASDRIELHQKGHKLHIFARLVCLLLAIVFWLFVQAWQSYDAQNEDAADDSSTKQADVETT